MGRTNPTYRRYLQQFEERWQPYRRALRGPYQERFDDLLEQAERFADAAGYHNSMDPDRAILLSMLLAHEIDRRALEARVDELESAIVDESE